MITTTIDEITRRYLFDNGLPMHYYCEALSHAATCLRELNFDTLRIINSANLPTDNTASLTLPADFADDVAVCIPSGQSLLELPRQDWITPLRVHDSTTGLFEPYTELQNDNGVVLFGYPFGAWNWFFNVDSFGTPTGAAYGSSGGTTSGYKVFKEQRRIQLSENFTDSNVVLLYISDGISVDNASQIDPQAFSTLTAFINWKRSPNRNNDNSPEGRNFYNQRRLLRARKNDLDISTLRNILHQSYTATVKN